MLLLSSEPLIAVISCCSLGQGKETNTSECREKHCPQSNSVVNTIKYTWHAQHSCCVLSKCCTGEGQWWCLPLLELGTGLGAAQDAFHPESFISTLQKANSVQRDGGRHQHLSLPVIPCSRRAVAAPVLVTGSQQSPPRGHCDPPHPSGPQVCHLTSTSLPWNHGRRQSQPSCRQSTLELGMSPQSNVLPKKKKNF